MTGIDSFFAFARERHSIYLRRKAGQPPPWTEDPILQQYRFTNVYRELDATTVWFREHVRDPLRDKPEVLLATVVFRLFNRITTGEAIFSQPALGLDDEKPGETAWQAFLRTLDTHLLRGSIRQYCDPGPYVTGSYIIKTPDGYDKLDGVLKIIEWFCQHRYPVSDTAPEFLGGPRLEFQWRGAAVAMQSRPWSLQDACSYIGQFPFIGDFTAYEIVSDLRHTALLDKAPDIMTWANPGPGCRRGLNVVMGRQPNENVSKGQMLIEMRNILTFLPDYWPVEGSRWTEMAKRASNWPRGEWPRWEMREVEHTLCEYYKYHRVGHGGPPPRQRFHHG